MSKTIYFNAGLPRSGTTLLQNIFNQNPRFYGSHTSGCLDTLFSIRNTWGKNIEHQAHPCQNKLTNVLKNVLHGYYDDIDKPVIVDKGRGWLAYIELIENILQKQVKILVPIRPVVDILASFEALFRETSKIAQPPSEAQNYFQFQTTKGRCEFLMREDQVVGLSLNRLNDAIRRGFKNRIHLIEFEKLTSNPKKTMKDIYAFLGEEYFEHDFDNVKQVTEEDDTIYGFVNLHKIREKVEPVKNRSEEILGKDLVEYIKKKQLNG